jgi:hypothetical protein
MPEETPDNRSMIDLAWEASTLHQDSDLLEVVTRLGRALRRLQQLLDEMPAARRAALAAHPIAVCWGDRIAALTEVATGKPTIVSEARNWVYHVANSPTDEEICMALNGCTMTVMFEEAKPSSP